MFVIRNLFEKLEKTKKRLLKAKTVSLTNPDYSNVRISNYIKIIHKEHIVFILQEDYKSS